MHTAEALLHGPTLAIELAPISPDRSAGRIDIALDHGRNYRLIVPQSARRQAVLAALDASGLAAIVPSSGRLIANLKAWENIVLPLAYRGVTELPELESRATALFEEFGYPGERGRQLASSLPDRLSRYERRLVAFARAVLAEPELLVLDGVAEGLPRADAGHACAFGAAFLRRFPFRTVVHIEAERPEAGGDWLEV